jgi:phage shock protein A
VPEPIFIRVRRVLSASAEDRVDALERASGASVMRESIRQVARAQDDVRTEQEALAARVASAKRQQGQARARIDDLNEKARFALGKDRDDLAEAAMSRLLDLEAELTRLDGVQAEAGEQAVRLDQCASALAQRKAQMDQALAAFEAARPDPAAAGGGDPERREQALQRKVDRAQETFDRVMAGVGGKPACQADDKEAEIDALRREEAIEARLAAMRAAQAKQAARPKRRAG